MENTVKRYSSDTDSTLGIWHVNGRFECYTLEDEYREVKVMHETRIPDGRYKLKLRAYGGHHERYAAHRNKEIRNMHIGMFELMDVPGFKHILIHCGNTDEHTSGCLIVGDSANDNTIEPGFIGNSTRAYISLYKKLVKAFNNGEDIYITIDTIG